MPRLCLLAALGLALSLLWAPAAQADGRPTDADGAVCTYRTSEAQPYDTPQGHIRVHYVADAGDPDAPAPTSTLVGGVPDWIVDVGAAAETAWARETALGFPPPPADDADGRYDVYVCDLGSLHLRELGATVADPPGSGTSFIVVDNDYALAEVAPLTTSGLAQLRVTVAHELFHAIQIGEDRGRLPEWLAEATAVWMEGIVATPDVDREIYRVALGGAGTEEPYWQGGDLHEYGAWWLIAQLESEHPGFVRRLLEAVASESGSDPRGLGALARALGGRRVLEADFARFARSALDDPLVGSALRARRMPRLRAGGRLVLQATLPPLSLRLWRVPVPVGVVTVRRAGARRLGAVVRRDAVERALGHGALALRGERGSLLVLAIGGAGSPQGVRLTLTSAR